MQNLKTFDDAISEITERLLIALTLVVVQTVKF